MCTSSNVRIDSTCILLFVYFVLIPSLISGSINFDDAEYFRAQLSFTRARTCPCKKKVKKCKGKNMKKCYRSIFRSERADCFHVSACVLYFGEGLHQMGLGRSVYGLLVAVAFVVLVVTRMGEVQGEVSWETT